MIADAALQRLTSKSPLGKTSPAGTKDGNPAAAAAPPAPADDASAAPSKKRQTSKAGQKAMYASCCVLLNVGTTSFFCRLEVLEAGEEKSDAQLAAIQSKLAEVAAAEAARAAKEELRAAKKEEREQALYEADMEKRALEMKILKAKLKRMKRGRTGASDSDVLESEEYSD